ncbi:MAG: hypothetical protein WKF77_10370 [Planctomycetaceae bacterium]
MNSRPHPNQRQRASLFFIAGYAVLVGIATALLLVVVNVLLPESFLAHGAMQSSGQDLMKFLSQREPLVRIAANPRLTSTFSEFGSSDGSDLEILKRHLTFESYPEMGSNAVKVYFEADTSEVAGNAMSAILASLHDEWDRVFPDGNLFEDAQRLVETRLKEVSKASNSYLEEEMAEYRKVNEGFGSPAFNAEFFSKEMEKIVDEIQVAQKDKTGENSLERIHSIINGTIPSESSEETMKQQEAELAASQVELEKWQEKLKEMKILISGIESRSELAEKESKTKIEERRRKNDEEMDSLITELKELDQRNSRVGRLIVIDPESKPPRRYFFQPWSVFSAAFVGVLLGACLGLQRGKIGHKSSLS